MVTTLRPRPAFKFAVCVSMDNQFLIENKYLIWGFNFSRYALQFGNKDLLKPDKKATLIKIARMSLLYCLKTGRRFIMMVYDLYTIITIIINLRPIPLSFFNFVNSFIV
jgi:hypothetical protein